MGYVGGIMDDFPEHDKFAYIDWETREKIPVTSIFQKLQFGDLEVLFGHPNSYPDVRGIYICVDEDTTLEEIKNQWHKIEPKRDQYFGKWEPRYDDDDYRWLLMRFYKIKDMFDLKFPELCRYINFEATVTLLRDLEDEPDLDFDGGLKTLFDTFNQSDDYVNTVQLAKDKLKSGRAPWNVIIEPIRLSKVKNRFKQFIDYLDKDDKRGDYRYINEDVIDANLERLLFESLMKVDHFTKQGEIQKRADRLLKATFDVWFEHRQRIFDLINNMNEELVKRWGKNWGIEY